MKLEKTGSVIELHSAENDIVSSYIRKTEHTVPQWYNLSLSRNSEVLPLNKIDWAPFAHFLDVLRQIGEPRELLEKLLDGLVGILKVSRGTVMLLSEDSKLLPVATFDKDETEDFVATSTTIAQRAVETANVVFVDGTINEEWFSSASAISKALLPRAIICCPLITRGRTLGVLYLDGFIGRSDINEACVPLLTMFAGLTAELIAAAETRSNLLEARERLVEMATIFHGEHSLILGSSKSSMELDEEISAAASQDVTVLITGETGTGKEMVARELHRRSKRAKSSFVPVNCAALPADIIEAELFGAEKGAYTGANEQRIGRFERASLGTLFLDELGELSLSAQVKLLRTLQERSIVRLGGTEQIPLDIRLVCATNTDLEKAVQEGTFREDIYYRVNVFRIHLQPLRERREDILPLAETFLSQFSERFNRNLDGFSKAAKELLIAHDWPGNVRELRNAIERAVIMEPSSLICCESLPIALVAGVGSSEADIERMQQFIGSWPIKFQELRELFERAYLTLHLEGSRGNLSEMSRQTGIPRNTLHRRLCKFNLVS